MEQPLKEEKAKSESSDEPTSSAPTETSNTGEIIPRGFANRKERKRTLTMNSAFSELRDHIPNVPPDTKLSKIKTLRLAISYIKFLMEILEESNEGKPGRSHRNFVADLAFQNEGREKRKRENIVSRVILNMLEAVAQHYNGQPHLYFKTCSYGLVLFLLQQPAAPSDSTQRKRGRTGWPQYVWAMELRN